MFPIMATIERNMSQTWMNTNHYPECIKFKYFKQICPWYLFRFGCMHVAKLLQICMWIEARTCESLKLTHESLYTFVKPSLRLWVISYTFTMLMRHISLNRQWSMMRTAASFNLKYSTADYNMQGRCGKRCLCETTQEVCTCYHTCLISSLMSALTDTL